MDGGQGAVRREGEGSRLRCSVGVLSAEAAELAGVLLRRSPIA